jgi:hypothetical protein
MMFNHASPILNTAWSLPNVENLNGLGSGDCPEIVTMASFQKSIDKP